MNYLTSLRKNNLGLIRCFILAALAAVWIGLSFTNQVHADEPLSQKLYLPIVSKPACLSTNEAKQLAQLLVQEPEQERVSLTCNTILMQVAQARAMDMAERQYFAHVNPDGYGPNYLVRQAGYGLPSFYSTALDGNNIESIAAGYATADIVWQGWMQSSTHRTHLLGLNSFFAGQIEYGIGYASDPDSPYRHYWVVLTAQPDS